jgi:hypothetical protein
VNKRIMKFLNINQSTNNNQDKDLRSLTETSCILHFEDHYVFSKYLEESNTTKPLSEVLKLVIFQPIF